MLNDPLGITTPSLSNIWTTNRCTLQYRWSR